MSKCACTSRRSTAGRERRPTPTSGAPSPPNFSPIHPPPPSRRSRPAFSLFFSVIQARGTAPSPPRPTTATTRHSSPCPPLSLSPSSLSSRTWRPRPRTRRPPPLPSSHWRQCHSCNDTAVARRTSASHRPLTRSISAFLAANRSESVPTSTPCKAMRTLAAGGWKSCTPRRPCRWWAARPARPAGAPPPGQPGRWRMGCGRSRPCQAAGWRRPRRPGCRFLRQSAPGAQTG